MKKKALIDEDNEDEDWIFFNFSQKTKEGRDFSTYHYDKII